MSSDQLRERLRGSPAGRIHGDIAHARRLVGDIRERGERSDRDRSRARARRGIAPDANEVAAARRHGESALRLRTAAVVRASDHGRSAVGAAINGDLAIKGAGPAVADIDHRRRRRGEAEPNIVVDLGDIEEVAKRIRRAIGGCADGVEGEGAVALDWLCGSANIGSLCERESCGKEGRRDGGGKRAGLHGSSLCESQTHEHPRKLLPCKASRSDFTNYARNFTVHSHATP